MKVVVVGGGSTYTPELIEGFANRSHGFVVDDLVLLDVDAERLAIVGGLAKRMLDRADWGGRLVASTVRDAALEGADFVLLQIRVGGQATRLIDETLPLRFGAIGQETTGPGGFAKALRTVPVVLDIAEAADRLAAPGAWIVDFTNPVGIVTQALLDGGHRAIGLCNVAIGLQRWLASRLGVAAERVELEHSGLNHLSWVRGVCLDGTDVLPGLIAADAAGLAAQVDSTEERVRALASIPSYYLRYYDDTAGALLAQRTGTSRAEDVMAIEQDLLERYRDPNLAEKPKQLEERGGAFYSEAAVQLIASLHAGTGDVQVVDVRNAGALPGIADDEVVEVPARITRDGPIPLRQAALHPEMLDLVLRVKAYERLTIRAALSGDRSQALDALSANPLVPAGVASPLLEALLEANRALLPRFFPEG
ncbi:MAG TPA: 6-phospho-beta-glucosidase [Candidatus Limnocylindrales bacterium]|nr:6-phospho-beta-glucosidase [Candidatus Limnocylindrales bacterium]